VKGKYSGLFAADVIAPSAYKLFFLYRPPLLCRAQGGARGYAMSENQAPNSELGVLVLQQSIK
jgi:hypothetical protein